ncbi:hypothetical protein EPD60_12095 [Flaviaesturariibacter flavus]|uniref:Uncharacterized protein n=1 Tax=Flaviaesturariibacter flavus TaxID=2502780 RepID=A0A4R1B9F7_9BACT|nr:hypothetical protein [Flaviaesturariibacter flavus]TCJ13534.1 hypothetical protein EPD60_12095 [Flaviaesturariibacter flavus]
MTISNKRIVRRLRFLGIGAALTAGVLIAVNSTPPAQAAALKPATSDSVYNTVQPYQSVIRAQQDSLLRRYPFLRQVHIKDDRGRLLDIFGRPLGC